MHSLAWSGLALLTLLWEDKHLSLITAATQFPVSLPMLTGRTIIVSAEANSSSSSACPFPFFFSDLQLQIQSEQLKKLLFISERSVRLCHHCDPSTSTKEESVSQRLLQTDRTNYLVKKTAAFDEVLSGFADTVLKLRVYYCTSLNRPPTVSSVYSMNVSETVSCSLCTLLP